MGGFGSGNWYRYNSKSTIETQHLIDVRWLKKQALLKPGTIGTLSWLRGKEQTGTISYRMEADRMILSYRCQIEGGAWEQVDQTILFDRTPCNYGGHRQWFLCPHCNKRVAVLYGVGKYFLCRHCYGLTYTSQQETKADRLMRKARKIRRRLGASANLTEPILLKPKQMHQKTFDRLKKEVDQASKKAMTLIWRKY